MQSDTAVDGEYETFDLHLPVSRQLIVRRVSFPVGPPRGVGGFGSVKLGGGQNRLLTYGGSRLSPSSGNLIGGQRAVYSAATLGSKQLAAENPRFCWLSVNLFLRSFAAIRRLCLMDVSKCMR